MFDLLRSARRLWPALALVLAACGTNPVTGKKELQLVGEAEEIAIGQQNYEPARQAQGGDYVIDPGLNEYVREVGNRLAAVSDRKLPYEFVVLNDGVPNAWAMPGGKIAVNRGLLYELKSESELAAVLGHEIVHAAARHGAKSMERGYLLQGAVMAVGLSSQNQKYSQLYVQGAQIAAQLISTRYGRDAELESDLYGTRYMKRAGYDPRASITLQETFVRLSKGRQQNFLDGLFASHPPSEERVAANRKTAAELGDGGETGEARYKEKTAELFRRKPAYDAHADGVRALAKGDYPAAATSAKRAISLEPQEARFHELMGDVELGQKRLDTALAHYAQAIRLQENYFKPHVQSGIALFGAGRRSEAEPYLRRSLQLLPTAPAHYFLGILSEERGKVDEALQHYQVAAGAGSDLGRQASARFVRLDLPRNPARYLQADVQAATDGTLYAILQNAAPVPLVDVSLRVVRTDGQRIVEQTPTFTLPAPLQPGKVAQIPMVRANMRSPEELQFYRVVVESVRAMPQQ